MAETPSAALEWRISELERVVGERPQHLATTTAPVVTELQRAAQSLQEAVCPQDAENRTQALRRATALHRHRASLPVPKAEVDGARERLDRLERELRDLATLSGVLDGAWRERPFESGEAKEMLRKVIEAADDAEKSVKEESKLVDDVLTRYNSKVEQANRKIERLSALVRAVEMKKGKRES